MNLARLMRSRSQSRTPTKSCVFPVTVICYAVVSKALLTWIVAQGIGTALIEPGNPWQNGVAESFNGKFRDECLSLDWFRSRAEAKVLIEK